MLVCVAQKNELAECKPIVDRVSQRSSNTPLNLQCVDWVHY